MDLLQVLADGEPLPAIADLLPAIVRDSTWVSRCQMLGA